MPVLGIDIQPIHPIDGAEFWVRDITDVNCFSFTKTNSK